MEGFRFRETTKMDLLLLGQYYKVLFKVIDKANSESEGKEDEKLREEIEEVCYEVEDVACIIRSMEEGWSEGAGGIFGKVLHLLVVEKEEE